MSNLVSINNHSVQIKEYNGQRVVTFKEIDEVHNRPDGTARRTFTKHRSRLNEGSDYFVCNTSEASQMGITAPNGLTLVTENGYKMLVKTFEDDRAWQVQRELVDTYFKVKAIDPMLELIAKDPIMAIRYNQLQMEKKLEQQEQQLKIQDNRQQLLEKRLDNLDTINISGTEQQRLNAMIRKYSYKEGILYNVAWNQFKQAFNTAYHTNLETLMNNFAEKHGLKKITTPQYLSMAGKIEDALRVADKLLNKAG